MINNKRVIFVPPTLENLGQAEFYWQRAFHSTKFTKWPSKDDTAKLAIQHGLWTEEKEQEYKKMPDKIKDMKEEMFLCHQAGQNFELLKQVLQSLKNKYKELTNQREQFYYITREGYADAVRNQFLVQSCISTEQPLSFAEMQQVLLMTREQEIMDEEYRIIVRDPLWMSYWFTAKEKLFAVPLGRLNFEQRTMCNIARMYDNAYGSPEAPDDEVFDNPDLFDGWAIHLSNKSKIKKLKSEVDSNIDPRSQNVFVVANKKMTPKDIYNMNSPASKQKLGNLFQKKVKK